MPVGFEPKLPVSGRIQRSRAMPGLGSGDGSTVLLINQVSYRQAISPIAIQARMNATMRFIVWGTIPIGAILGGVIATAVGVHNAIWIGALGPCLPFLCVLLSPVRSLRAMPEAAG